MLDDDGPLFSCFTFRKATPVAAAAKGRLPLPPGTACLEDSVTSAAARGRGIAPACWTLIGDELAAAGFTTLVTKIETSNAASRRAVEKVGFEPVAVMDFVRVGARRRTAVEALGGHRRRARHAPGLAAQLAVRVLEGSLGHELAARLCE